MHPNRRQRRAATARARRRPPQRHRPRPWPQRLALIAAGTVLIALLLALLGTLHGSKVPRALLLLPVLGLAAIALALQG